MDEAGCAGGPTTTIPSPSPNRRLSNESLWEQQELLASQTLTDLALGRPTAIEEKGRSKVVQEKAIPRLEMAASAMGHRSWTDYAPSSSFISHLQKSTQHHVKPIMAGPPEPTATKDPILDIAHALEELHCKRNPESDAEPQPKQKKRRRRRHEITRNFKCTVSNCSKSYGSEGALKTHIRLKHSGDKQEKRDEKRRSFLPSSMAIPLERRRDTIPFASSKFEPFWFAGGAGGYGSLSPMTPSPATPHSPIRPQPILSQPTSPLGSSDMDVDPERPLLPPILSVLAGDGHSPDEANQLLEKQKQIPRFFNFVRDSGLKF